LEYRRSQSIVNLGLTCIFYQNCNEYYAVRIIISGIVVELEGILGLIKIIVDRMCFYVYNIFEQNGKMFKWGRVNDKFN